MKNIVLNISKIYDVNRNYFWSHPNSPGIPGSGKNEPDNTFLILLILLGLIIYLMYMVKINQ